MALDSKITPGKVYGPFVWRGRRQVTIEHDGHKCSMTYARWLMQEHLGRLLGPDEHVHHKDEDPLNDVVSNYVIRSPGDHRRDHQGNVTMLDLVCPMCDSPFQRDARFVRRDKKVGKAGPFCGRVCAGTFNARVSQPGRGAMSRAS